MTDATTRFTVNGAAVSASSAKGSLLDALRAQLNFTSARFGCGEGHCGACTVIVDGNPVQACQTPLWSLEGAAVRTIEGLDGDARAARVRAVFIEEQAAQCGYCTNGIVMTIAALLSRGQPASRREIVAALDERHLCRCGAHARVLRALDRLLAEMAEAA